MAAASAKQSLDRKGRVRDASSELESIIDLLIGSGLLSLSDSVRWELRDGYLRARLPVAHQDYPEGLRLEILKNPRISKYSFQLMFRGKAARRFCSNHTHQNPVDCPQTPGQEYDGYHKHRWSDTTGDECIYKPTDFALDSIEEAFYAFCDECNIEFNGVWNDPPEIQLGFETLV